MATDSTLPVVVAIDGPSASGKGTVAQLVATRLGFHYLDSGSIYRAFAYAAHAAGEPLDDEDAMLRLVVDFALEFVDGEVRLRGIDISDALRTEQIGNFASLIATLPRLRSALLDMQRRFRRPPGLVADGRDMGTVVFPDAVLKVFLTASARVRAERRLKQLMEKGIRANIAVLLTDIEARDARDAARPVAPLKMSPDASLLDTTDLAIEAAVGEILARYERIAAVSRR